MIVPAKSEHDLVCRKRRSTTKGHERASEWICNFTRNIVYPNTHQVLMDERCDPISWKEGGGGFQKIHNHTTIQGNIIHQKIGVNSCVLLYPAPLSPSITLPTLYTHITLY